MPIYVFMVRRMCVLPAANRRPVCGQFTNERPGSIIMVLSSAPWAFWPHVWDIAGERPLLEKYERGKIMFIFVKSQCHRHIYQPIVSLDKQRKKYDTKCFPPVPLCVCFIIWWKIFQWRELWFRQLRHGEWQRRQVWESHPLRWGQECEYQTWFLIPFSATASHGSSNTVKRRPESTGAPRVTRPRHLKQKKEGYKQSPANGEINCTVLSQFSCQDQINEAQKEIRLHTVWVLWF